LNLNSSSRAVGLESECDPVNFDPGTKHNSDNNDNDEYDKYDEPHHYNNNNYVV
jgi:hypothetical protein